MEEDKVEDDDVEKEGDHDVEDDVEEEDRSQDLGPNAQQHVTRATWHGHLQEKCRSPEPRPTLCASLRGRSAHQHVTRATLYGNLQEKCRSPELRRRLRASLRINMSQEALRTEINGRMPFPRAATHTLCEPVRSKCTPTSH